jgi:hypothetical protein
MRTLGLVPTPELEPVLSNPLIKVMGHNDLLDLTQEECHARVMGVGSVIFQLLAAQHEFGEPLNLNGDLIEDLLDNTVVCRSDGNGALEAMFSALSFPPTAKTSVLTQEMLKFNRDHTWFDQEFRPPTFRRDRRSDLLPSHAIPVVVGGGLNLKRQADDEPEDEKSKPAKLTKMGKEGRTAKTSDQMVATSTPRRLRSGKVV